MLYIRNIRDLREALAYGHRNFKIHLCGGDIFWDEKILPCTDGRFGIVDYFDRSITCVTARQLQLHKSIGKAMKTNTFTT